MSWEKVWLLKYIANTFSDLKILKIKRKGRGVLKPSVTLA